MISVRHLATVRDLWLRACLLVAVVALASIHELWLAMMAGWFLCRWKSPELHASLLTWCGIAGTWLAFRALPGWAWEWIPRVWLLIMVCHVGYMLYVLWTLPRDHPFFSRDTLLNIKRVKSSLGSPAISAISLALTAPFCPLWLWPVLAVGLYITWAWTAFIGVAIALSWMYPQWAGLPLLVVIALLALWLTTWTVRKFNWRGQRWMEWTPRGDSADSIINRLLLWVIIPRAWWTGGHRLLGHGPYSLEPELRRWASRCWIETPNGEAHCEWAQVLYEYGLVGVLAVSVFAGRVIWNAHLGDSYTAAFLAGLVMTFAHWSPARHPAVALVVLACAAGAMR